VKLLIKILLPANKHKNGCKLVFGRNFKSEKHLKVHTRDSFHSRFVSDRLLF